jgi:hypothetical protein
VAVCKRCVPAAFSNRVHAMPPRRCSSLQELEVAWLEDTNDDRRNSLAFKGTGRTAQEQRASMQRQLAALCSSTTFMAPDSWPSCSCLTSLAVQRASFEDHQEFVVAATRTPSLVHLEVHVEDDSAPSPLRRLSDLQRLTHLKYGHPLLGFDRHRVKGAGSPPADPNLRGSTRIGRWPFSIFAWDCRAPPENLAGGGAGVRAP